MNYLEQSEIIYDAFLTQHGIHLFRKQDGNLISANSGNKSPYKILTEYRGLSIGVSFQHLKSPAIEVYLKENLTANQELSNAIFDTFSSIFSHYGVKFSSIKAEGAFDLYLAPFSLNGDNLRVACSILKDLSENFGELRRTSSV
ncbi:hypothetical protein ATY37_19995 [Vibrio cidicii]|uniref:Uncharacterized protein n=1 Tax=Vibrio cidicii TaxID=1763883 RepID=A0A151KUF4_9VIBR|nr:hypothetical protein [Vibrio cidicii]KYN84996.1 hypothetical protein ATY37_19995 [Vibrio cidicii]